MKCKKQGNFHKICEEQQNFATQRTSFNLYKNLSCLFLIPFRLHDGIGLLLVPISQFFLDLLGARQKQALLWKVVFQTCLNLSKVSAKLRKEKCFDLK